MKVSKIRHTKVAVRGGENSGGFLYRNPVLGKYDKNLNLEKHINQQIQAADALARGNKYNAKKPENQNNKEKLIATAEAWEKKRKNVIKHTQSGIENQNLVIQPMISNSDDSKEAILAPSSVKNAIKEKQIKKRDKKDAFRQFFFDFAVLDKKEREDMLRKLRRLLLLYFYGEKEIMDMADDDFDVWKNHNEKKSCDDFFVTYEFKNNDTSDESVDDESGKTLKDVVRDENIKRFRDSATFVKKELESGNTNNLFFNDESLNMFWIEHIESSIERIFNHDKRINSDFKLRLGYLSEKVWKDIINYLSIKYIAVGKTVYHTAMSNINTFDKDGVMRLGIVDKEYIDGISSFEFENIKAEESFQRELSMYISFAARHLADATIERGEDREDILVLSSRKIDTFMEFNKKDEKGRALKDENDKNIKYMARVLKDDADRNILQFFGGKSRWIDAEKNLDSFEELKSEDIGRELVNEAAGILYDLRNKNFHFADSVSTENNKENKAIDILFKNDIKEYDIVMKDKMYSNNVPMFYKEDDIRKLIDSLYGSYSERASQIPSFNNIVKRNKLDEFLSEKKYHINTPFADKVKDNWKKAIYYVLKEIYYNSFICSDEAKGLFLKSLQDLKNPDYDSNFNIMAVNDFIRRIKGNYDYETKRSIGGITGYSLSEICQIIMTEFNQQNSNNKKKKSAKVKDKNKDSYPHYRDLLYKAIESAFIKYLKNHKNLYEFLRNPIYREDFATNLPRELFLKKMEGCKIKRFDNLIKDAAGDTKLESWYVLGMMLTPKQLNQLSGIVKNYIGYKKDVLRRAKQTGNEIRGSFARDKELSVALMILEMCLQLSGRTSNKCEDYFENEDEYARYIAKFLDFDNLSKDYSISPAIALREYCVQNDISLFYDGSNPIMDRNIIYSKIYGSGEVLAKIFEDNKVTHDEIIKLMKTEKEENFVNYKKNGRVSNIEEVKSVRQYQNQKNHVQLRDLVDYAEIVDELLGQLIKWSYLRERDLMYFQLGFHYACLHNNSEKHEAYKTISFEDKKIEGAILYQIVAMNTFGMPLYFKRKNKKTKEFQEDYKAGCDNVQYSQKLNNAFASYSIEMYGKDDYLYNAGLDLFEVLDEHESIIKLRNYIEHFHYYYDALKGENRSLLELYSEVFDRFFTYDMKYHKNVPNVLYNILLEHFVNARFDYLKGSKKMDKGTSKDCALIQIKKSYGICLELLKYKFKDKDEDVTVTIPARDERFIRNVAKLLNYPNVDVEVGYYKDQPKEERKNKKKAGGKNSNSNSNYSNKNSNNSNSNYSNKNSNNRSNNNCNNKKGVENNYRNPDEDFTYNPFKEFFEKLNEK